LVTGATGFIGQYLVKTLLLRGEEVRILSRHPERIPSTWLNHIEVSMGNICEKDSLFSALKGVDIVYHLAGEIHDKKLYYTVNHEGTENLLETCATLGIKRFLHYSSVGVIGAKDHGIYDEQSVCNPSNDYERSKYLGEKAALRFFQEGRLDVSVVRPTIVLGPRMNAERDSFLSWMKSIKSGQFRLIGSDDAIVNYVYVEDVIESCIFIAQDDQAIGEIYHISDSCKMSEFIECAVNLLGVRYPGHLIKNIAYALAIAFETIGKILKIKPPLTVARLKALTSQTEFCGDKLKQKFKFPFGWREGLKKTILAYKEMKLL